MLNKLKSISKIQLLAIVLIVVGLALTVRYARGLFVAYRALEFARDHGFDAGNPDPDLIRPWMNMRYIAVAYTVPQEFLFNEIGVPLDRETSNTPLGRLNNQFELGTRDGQPVLIERVRQAILKYRADPVPTGLRERGVRPWMSVQYIANSTGIPPKYIFEQIGVPMAGHAFTPLDRLSDEVGYDPGLEALVEAIQQIVDTYEEPE